jgi:hypothetical protein
VPIAPFVTAWAVRTGTRKLWLYSPILWIVLAAWLVLVVPWNAAYGEYSVLILGLVGLVVLGFIPAHKWGEDKPWQIGGVSPCRFLL